MFRSLIVVPSPLRYVSLRPSTVPLKPGLSIYARSPSISVRLIACRSVPVTPPRLSPAAAAPPTANSVRTCLSFSPCLSMSSSIQAVSIGLWNQKSWPSRDPLPCVNAVPPGWIMFMSSCVPHSAPPKSIRPPISPSMNVMTFSSVMSPASTDSRKPRPSSLIRLGAAETSLMDDNGSTICSAMKLPHVDSIFACVITICWARSLVISVILPKAS